MQSDEHLFRLHCIVEEILGKYHCRVQVVVFTGKCHVTFILNLSNTMVARDDMSMYETIVSFICAYFLESRTSKPRSSGTLARTISIRIGIIRIFVLVANAI